MEQNKPQLAQETIDYVIERIDFIMEECHNKSCCNCWNLACNDNENPKKKTREYKGQVAQKDAKIPFCR